MILDGLLDAWGFVVPEIIWIKLATIPVLLTLSGCASSDFGLNPYRAEENWRITDNVPLGTRQMRGGVPTIPENRTFDRLTHDAADTNQAAPIRLFLTSGMALSDDLCSQWFQRLGAAQAKAEFAKGLVGNLGALSAVLLGVTGGGTAAVSAVAAGTTFTQNSIDSGVASFIVAPDVGVVQRGVQLLRDSKRTEILQALDSAEGPERRHFDFFQARSALISYDNLCSHNEIKRYVDAAVKNTNDKAALINQSAFYQQISAVVVAQVQGLFPAAATIDENALAELWALNGYTGTLSAADKDKIKAELVTAQLYKTAKAKTPNFKDGKDHTAQLQSYLLSLNAAGDLDRTLVGLVSPSTAAEGSVSPATPGKPPAPAPKPALSLGNANHLHPASLSATVSGAGRSVLE